MPETIAEYYGHRIRILRDSYRRKIKLTVEVRGDLQMRVGRSATDRQIVAFLAQHRDWIEAAVAQYAQLRSQFPPKQFVHGEIFLFLGEERILQLNPYEGARPQVVFDHKSLFVFVPEKQWHEDFIKTPHPEFAMLIRKKYEQEGRRILPERVAFWSERTGLRPKVLSVRGQRSRWGSLSPSGRMSLNWKLVLAPLAVVDYVVIHELCHIAHANHSRRFWSLVGAWDADYKKHRDWLKAHHLAFDVLTP